MLMEILDKLLDFTGWEENRQDHLKAALCGAVVELYHGYSVAGDEEKAQQISDFGVKYCGLVKDDFSRWM